MSNFLPFLLFCLSQASSTFSSCSSFILGEGVRCFIRWVLPFLTVQKEVKSGFLNKEHIYTRFHLSSGICEIKRI